MKSDFLVKVPGTSANLGSGFDLFGLALDIYNEFHFFESEHANFNITLHDDSPLPFEVKDNLIKNAYLYYANTYLPNIKMPYYNIKIKMNLPVRGGLGSSASALIAGFLAANLFHKSENQSIPLPSESEILTEIAKMEGHPDNTSAAILGGFVFSYFTERGLIYFKKKFPKSIQLYIFIPELETDTNDSRNKLPEQYKTEDLVFNMGRVCTWLEFLSTGKIEYLSLSLQDRVHTPYRIKSVSFLKDLSEVLKINKIYFSLSGSGPTLLIYSAEEDIGKFSIFFQNAIQKCTEKYSIKYKFFPIQPSNTGTEIII